MISRIVTISLIVLAFSNPYIPNSETKVRSENTFIYIDNSFSMDDISEKGRLLDIAKEKALKILNANKKTNKFWIITDDFSSSEKIRNKKDVLEKQKTLISEMSSLYMISDFQKSSTDLNTFLITDSTRNIILIPINKNKNNNISLDSCFLQSPINGAGTISSINVIITNNSSEEINDILINLEINKKQKTQQNISLSSFETKKVKLSFLTENTRINNGNISINDHPITFDNKLYFSYLINEKTNVCQISMQENILIRKLFKEDKKINYTNENINQLDYNHLVKQDLIILSELDNFSTGFITKIKEFIITGGSLCIIPKKQANREIYNSFLQSLNIDLFGEENNSKLMISSLNLQHPIFNNVFNNKNLRKDIDLPKIDYYYKLKKNSSSLKQNIYRMENGDEFLNYYNVGKGQIYLFSSPLSSGNNNFSKHALFVTTLYNMGLNSVISDNLYNQIGSKSSIKLPKINNQKKNIFHLKNENTDVISNYSYENNSIFLIINNQIKIADHYNLFQEEEILSSISFNYNRKESNTDQYKTENIENFVLLNNIVNIKVYSENITIKENLEQSEKDKVYWKLLILLSLIFLALEIFLIKTIKT